jgi:hypothetical protein
MSAPALTYRLHTIAGATAIECLLCDRISELPGDVANRYCGRCHLFHEAIAQGRQLVAAGGTHECAEWQTFRGRCALCDSLLTKAGTFYGIKHGERRMLQLDPSEVAGRAPESVICRRVADYPRGVPPAAATIGRCAKCAAPIAFNAARFPDRPHVCMQCAQIMPDPYPEETP